MDRERAHLLAALEGTRSRIGILSGEETERAPPVAASAASARTRGRSFMTDTAGSSSGDLIEIGGHAYVALQAAS